MRYIYSLWFVLSVCTGFCQSSVTLSGGRASVVINSSERAANRMVVELSASDPLALSRFELELQERGVSVSTLYCQVTVIDNVAEVTVDKHKAAFEGRKVRIMFTVRDQFKEPFTSVRVKGYDLSNKETNTLTFNLQQ